MNRLSQFTTEELRELVQALFFSVRDDSYLDDELAEELRDEAYRELLNRQR